MHVAAPRRPAGRPLRTVVVGLASAAVVFALLFVVIVRTTTDALGRERVTRDALLAARDMLQLQVDEETGIRGFTSTDDPLFLQPYLESQRRFAAVARGLERRATSAGIALDDVRAIKAANAAWRQAVAEPLLGRPLDSPRLQIEGKHRVDAFRQRIAALQAKLDAAVAADEARAVRALGLEFAISGLGVAMLVVVALATVVADERRRREVVAALGQLARTDPLTGLTNRRSFADYLDAAIGLAEHDGSPFAIAYIDLDGFKAINDRRGHDAGDRVLCEVARRLESIVRARDVVARFGGDEFVIFLASADDARATTARLAQTFERPFNIADEATISVNASIGIATYPVDGIDAVALLAVADRRMYALKPAARVERLVT